MTLESSVLLLCYCIVSYSSPLVCILYSQVPSAVFLILFFYFSFFRLLVKVLFLCT